jgi:hypothetical protein
MKQAGLCFIGRSKLEEKEGGRLGKMDGTTSALGTEILSLRPACPQSVSKGGVVCWFLLDIVRDHRPGESREYLGQSAYQVFCFCDDLNY